MALIDAFERRSHPSNPDRWLLRAFGGHESAAGNMVDETTAMSATAFSNGVRIIAGTLAMLPLKLYERIDERSKQPARSMGLFSLLHDAPNEEQTSYEYREMQEGFALVWGNCYAQKLYNGRGEVAALWPLVPWRVTPERSRSQTLVYRVQLPGNDGGTVTLPADDVLHIRGFTSTGTAGDNPVTAFRNAIGMALAAEEFGGRFFGNGLSPSGILEHPKTIGKEAAKNLRESTQERQGGLLNAHRFMILEEGMKWHQLTMDPEKAQALEMRKFQVTEVARVLNLPPHFLKDLDRATFSNIEQQGQEFVTYTMQPWLTNWEQRMNKSLLLPSQRSRFFTKFEFRGLLRGDSAARSAFYNAMFNMGAYSPNQILEHEDEEPVPGGDQRFVQGAMVPLDKIAEIVLAQIEAKKQPPPAPAAPTEPEPDPEPRSIRPDPYVALEPVVRSEIDRIVRRQVKAVRGALKKGPQEFRIWADGFFEKEPALMTESLGPALLSLAALTGQSPDARAFAQIDTDRALAELRGALVMPDQLEERVGAVLARWESERIAVLTNHFMQRPLAA